MTGSSPDRPLSCRRHRRGDRRLPPDAVVPDAFLFGSIIAAQGAALPGRAARAEHLDHALPRHAADRARFRSRQDGPRSQPRRGHGGAWSTACSGPACHPSTSARSAYGLAPLSSFYDQALSVERILVLTSPTFDYAASSVPANVRYVGPILDDPEWAQPWTSPWARADERPLVLVGFSSTYQNQGPVLRRVVEALSTLPVRAVVTVGQMLDARRGHLDRQRRRGRARPPTAEILAEASLAVSHCGHGTTMKTLAAGVPMVCIPMGRDQNDTAARVVYHGAGVRLSPSASAARIRKAVQRVLGDDRLRANAARLASAIADEGSTADLVTELETLVR